MAYRHNVQVGHVVELIIKNRLDQQGTQVIGQVTGVAESWLSPDRLRLMIAGIEWWFDLNDDTMIERLS